MPLALQGYAQALRDARADLVVAPETAIPLLPRQLSPGYLEGLQQRYAQGAQAALLGIPLGDDVQGYTNLRGPGPCHAGDALPLRQAPPGAVRGRSRQFFRWFTAMMDIPGDFNRGVVAQPSFVWAGQRIAPNICYEDLFGEELGARFIDPAQAPTVFVNFSNIGWFGNTVATTSTCTSAACAPWSSSAPWCAPPTPAPRPSSTTVAWSPTSWSGTPAACSRERCGAGGGCRARLADHALCLVGVALGPAAAVDGGRRGAAGGMAASPMPARARAGLIHVRRVPAGRAPGRSLFRGSSLCL